MNQATIPIRAVRHEGGTQIWLRFALICTLLLLTAIGLEPFMGPLNRATAVLSGNALTLLGFEPVVRGDLITLNGFTVKIISECTSLHATLLLDAFILATPATPWERLAGMIAGGALLSSFNLLRIAALTIVAVKRTELFEVVHVYLGQVVTLLLVVGWCLVWSRSARGQRLAGAGFVVRCLIWACLLLPFWLALNVSYIKALDAMVARLFALDGYRLVIPCQHAVYYQTGNLLLLASLFLAECRVPGRRRIALGLAGVTILAAGHLLFRVCNVMITAFGWLPGLPLSSVLLLSGQYVFPILLWLAMRCKTEAAQH